MRLSGQGMGNGSNFGDENVLRGTRGGGVKAAGGYAWIDNAQIFLTANSEPTRGSNCVN